MPYCQIIADLYTGNGVLNSLKMAKKLSTCFGNLGDIKSYLKTVNYDTKETIELSFQFNLPQKLSPKTLEFFQILNKSGRDSLYIFSNAHLLEKTEKFQKILKKNKLNDFQQITKNDLKELVTEIVIKESYKYNEEELSEENKLHAKNLANFSLKGKLDNNSFQKALNFIKEDYMPDINFDIEVFF